ncbi:MAG TPA: dihydroorotase [Candidatus Kapabacteria bacterium]|nr:dihydroorotase [Candidatus Kapabacteria bacterium]HRT67381.1 dihydroorotase [Bacteroidota bacterium]
MNILFTNISINSPLDKINSTYNLWIKDGVIHKLTPEEIKPDFNTEIIDGSYLTVIPGLFDMHIHFRDPGFEAKEDIISGASAAANGGFTGVLIMPNTKPCIDDKTVIEYIKSKSKDLLCDVFIAGALTQSMEGKIISNMIELAEHGALLFTDDGKCVLNSEVMRRAFDYASPKNFLIAQHCEDTTMTENFDMNESDLSVQLGLKGYPSIAEEIILARDVLLSQYCGNRRYHAQHISTKGSVDIIRQAKKRNPNISCEVTPHHFSLTEEYLVEYNTNFKMNPPLRKQGDIDALIQGLKDGTIDVIASDHAPHSQLEKDVEFDKAPYGIIGLETSFGLSYTNLVAKGYLSLEDLIYKMSINPRNILGLENLHIKQGNKANITIVNTNAEWIVNKENFKSKSKNTPINEMKLQGKVFCTINNNQMIKSSL